MLNDPTRFLPRAALLRTLKARGLTSFTCWLPALGEMPDRFPVFLRTLAAHRGALTALLATPEQAETALREALDGGYAISDLGFVEFRAEPTDGRSYRKHVCYRVGERILRAETVSDTEWMAKMGALGEASEEDYKAELSEVADYPHALHMKEVFDVAGVAFGRADFGIVAGRPEVHEINTNPTIGRLLEHPSETRMKASRMMLEDLYGIAAPTPGRTDPGVEIRSVLPRWTRKVHRVVQP